MTRDQIDRMVRQANPVSDLKVLEPVDASVLVLDQQRRTEMQTHNRVEVDQEPERPRRGLLIGVAAAAAIVVGVILVQTRDGSDLAGQPSTPVEIATAFVEAYGSFDADLAASYLATDANILLEGGKEGWRDDNRYLEAQGSKLFLDSCEERITTLSGTVVVCKFDFHGIRSDEIGLGPFSGSWFDLTVQDGEIVSVSLTWGIEEYSVQMWEPFAEWVAETYPDDVAIMYTDSSQSMYRYAEESARLWEQRSREYVEVVRGASG